MLTIYFEHRNKRFISKVHSRKKRKVEERRRRGGRRGWEVRCLGNKRRGSRHGTLRSGFIKLRIMV
jgi:hypothetical protein